MIFSWTAVNYSFGSTRNTFPVAPSLLDIIFLTMSDTYPQLCDELFSKLEELLDDRDDESDYESNGSICEVNLANGHTLVVNRQPASEEIWLAAKTGGYHFRHVGGIWVDTRDGSEFFARLNECLEA